jgi:hypothetical protein
MHTRNCRNFKGEIEFYLKNGQNVYDSKIDSVFQSLKFKTWLCRANIKKQEGYHAAHLLFILFMLPLLQLKTVNSFCRKQWQQWSRCRKDTYYRFKQNASYRWRTFVNGINHEIFGRLDLHSLPQKDLCFVIDDTILQKAGRKIENVTYVHDHNLGRSVLGFCVVALGLFTGNAFYTLDHAYFFSNKRHAKTPEKIGDPRSSSGLRSYEAKHCTKLELALSMIQRAVNTGILPGYVLFDSWYSWPWFIQSIRNIHRKIHVVCRLKDSNVHYWYNGRKYRLSGLYKKIRDGFKKDTRTGLLLKRVKVTLPDSDEPVVIVFSKGYQEPELESANGRKKKKEPSWVAFLCTDTSLHSSSIIKKYIQRWPIEVCFKECKQMLGLGKDQSNDFNGQVNASSLSFLRYNVLNYLNVAENYSTMGGLFESLADDAAIKSYSARLWKFFRGLFCVIFSKIFDLFDIQEEFQSYIDALEQALTIVTPFQGCET